MQTELSSQVASYVRRARAGDENAMAMLARVGEEARKGTNKKAQATFAMMKAFIERNPAKPFTLGAEPALVGTMSKPSTALAKPTKKTRQQLQAEPMPQKRPDPELKKPPLPRGIFDGMFDPERFTLTIVRACGYRYGMPAAAVVLASGPLLTKNAVQELGISQFGSDESSACFFHGVRFSGESDWTEVAPYLDPVMRRCLAVGQCVGRARKIQAVRMKNSPIGAYSEVAGWELGEQ
jgi:hypothetical protein